MAQTFPQMRFSNILMRDEQVFFFQEFEQNDSFTNSLNKNALAFLSQFGFRIRVFSQVTIISATENVLFLQSAAPLLQRFK